MLMNNLLLIIIIIPLIGCLNIIFLKDINKVKKIGLFYSILTLFFIGILLINFKKNISTFQYVIQIDWIPFLNFSCFLGVDGISIYLICLTGILIPICLLSNWNNIKFGIKLYIILFLTMESMLCLVFSILDILGFYIFFESILIPMYLIIGIWGAREEKILAGYYFFIYTLIGSVLFLLSIIYIYYEIGTTNYIYILNYKFNFYQQIFLWLGFFFSLAVKIPKIPFHIWLPQAHVEAPLGGSIILAGVLLKIGGYGFIRFSISLFPDASVYFLPFIYLCSVLAVIYASLTTIRQIDMKRIIAYSSVAHMSIVTLGIFSGSIEGLEGSIFLMIAHGIVSSSLFIMVTILYDRYHSRLLKYYRGVTYYMPLYSFFFLIFSLANIAMPLTCNFIGEVYILISVFKFNFFIGLLSSLGMVLSAGYSLFFYNRVCFGYISKYLETNNKHRDLNRREFFLILPLFYLSITLGIMPNTILDFLHKSSYMIIYLTLN